MLAATVFNTVVTTLQGNDILAKYIKNVFKGWRYKIEPDSMPCIFVDIASNNEIQQEIHTYKKLWLGLKIIAYTYNMVQPDKTVVGDDDYKGVLDIENDIRACLQASYTLGNNVIDIKYEPTVFYDFKEFPYRGFEIPIKILYQQTEGV